MTPREKNIVLGFLILLLMGILYFEFRSYSSRIYQKQEPQITYPNNTNTNSGWTGPRNRRLNPQ